VALTVALAFPAVAAANDFQNVYRDYKRTGTIKACRFSDKQLANAERQTPPDVEQYAPSFLDALQSARERNADCGKKPAAAPAPAPTSTTPSAAPPTASTPAPTPAATPTTTASTPAPTTTPAPPPPPGSAVANVASPPINAAEKDDNAPVAVWLIAALGALVLLSALFAGLAWWFGWGPPPTTRGGGASWGDFGAWIREGW
jgi:Tfp pilus assembly protein FimV